MKDIYQMGNLILHKIFLGNNNIAVLEKKNRIDDDATVAAAAAACRAIVYLA